MSKLCRFSFVLSMTTILSGVGVSQAAVRHKVATGRFAPAQNVKKSSAPKPEVVISSTSEQLSVSARRIVHGAVETVSQRLLSQAPAGTNPMKVLGSLPGVMFQSDDPQGLNTWSIQIFMHGFQAQELGMTLDGMPLGELAYRNYNGLNPVLAISSENVQRVNVSQSAGAEDVAATNNLGGTLAYISSDPHDKLGGSIRQGFGSYGNFHTFVRFDSGDLNRSGSKFYVSYMRNNGNLWKGYGNQFSQQVNAKFVQPLGHDSRISAFFDWSDIHQFTMPDTSPEVIHNLGYNVPNYYNARQSGLQAAINAANGVYPAGFDKLADKTDSAYYEATNNTQDLFGGIKADIRLNDRLTWNTTAYGHGETNQTTWTTPYYPSPGGSPLSELVKEPEIRRFGIISQLHYKIAHNEIGGGVWYENNAYQSPMNAYSMPNIVNGKLTSAIPDPLGNWKHPFAEIYNQNYNTNTFTAFVNDTYHVLSNLALHFGFKSVLSTTRVGDGYLNQDYYGAGARIASSEGLTTAKAFLPHISADWHFLRHHELFFDISENVHTYAECGYKLCASPFAVSQEAFDQTKSSLHPETAWTYAVGYRYNDQHIGASVYAYRTNFNNRLQQITSGSSINPISTVANVGGVTMNGVDAALTIMPIEGLSLTNSISYNHATYDNNITEAGTVYALKGSQVVNYPRFMYKSRLSYSWHGLLTYVDGSYTGTRNYSYTGDVKVPGYWLANAGVEYSFGDMKKYSSRLGAIKNIVVSFNAANLSNSRYISTMGENGNPMNIASGAMSFQSMLVGAPRMFFGSIRADF